MSEIRRNGGQSAAGRPRPGAVAICVCTLRRPEGLTRLLTGLAALRFSKVAPPAISIVLADNDPAASAKDVVAEMRSRIPWPILYVHEPRRGLAFARNATLDALPAEARWIAFIDDDEEPAPAWLDELLATALTHAAPIVAGPVRPAFQSKAPEWIVAGGFFRLGPYRDGAAPPVISTNNALIEAVHVRRRGWRFDLAFNHTGGEDQHFFTRAVEAGLKAVTAAEADVVETVPSARMSLSWLLRRHFRMGYDAGQDRHHARAVGPFRGNALGQGHGQDGAGSAPARLRSTARSDTCQHRNL